MALRTLNKVDANYATTGPNSTTISQALPVSAATAFRCVTDPDAYPQWMGNRFGWTSDGPHQAGSTRTIIARGSKTFETITEWRPGRRFALRFDKTKSPLQAFGADYVFEPAGGDNCELSFSFAFAWYGISRAVMTPIYKKMITAQMTTALTKLEDLLRADSSPWE